jgi:V8-like Glu-specific endopeptidase
MKLHASLAVLAMLAAPLCAQVQNLVFETKALAIDSGWRANAAANEVLLFSARVQQPGAVWLRLHLDDSNLPGATRLELTARADGAVQRFDATSLRDYGYRSAYLNGDEVTVELFGAPGVRGARLHLPRVEVGPVQIAPLSQCGPTDDRQPSQDKRSGRQYPTGCSSWLISETVVLTAGHCTANASQQVHFNVPLSSSTGQLRFPPPQDQYAYDTATLQRLDAGVGSDWTVTTVHRNSNTKLYPGQAQGVWYEIGTVPTTPAGQNIRITGYGTGGQLPEWNQAQKTHVGPLNLVRTTSLCYVTDTTGGNSGSPIIHENTGKAVGIHTHGGCTTSGSGCNSGTRIDRSDLTSAIATARNRKHAGSSTPFGTGCGGSAGKPALGAIGFPDLGATYELQVQQVLAGQAGTMMLGASDQKWGNTPLPLALDGIGGTGCSLLVSPDWNYPLATGAGTPKLGFTVPVDTTLIGRSMFAQYASIDKPANPLGVSMTQGLKITIGD